ncbi:DNA-directed DNA polymerase [Synchytrium endobioticum]|uniref:DNA-directed DNA polymerase n=1 Tax=Synchytrium endobioticum TaxID=286115 RepID=A0A507D7Y0_9FUNG|nr:DNA-directed DNA polymerase [Synchytrium endobioticum]
MDKPVYQDTSLNILHNTTDEKIPKNIEEAKSLPTWQKWKEAIQSEYKSLKDRNVFSEIMELPKGRHMIGNRIILTIKQEPAKRYKARLVAQGFGQRYGIDYQATYAPVLDCRTYRYLIGISTFMNWETHAMDIQTAYLYGELSEEIFMKVPEGLKTPTQMENPCIKLQKSIYGLKQSGRQWFAKYSEVLKGNGFTNTQECPSVFFKLTENGPVITPIYVDDTNVMGPAQAVANVKKGLASHFQMKDFGKVSQCVGIEVDHLPNGTFIHQSRLISKILRTMNLMNTKTRQSPLQVRSTSIDTDLYAPIRDGEAWV